MNKVIFIVFIFLFIANGQDVQDIIEDVQDTYDEIKNFSASFKKIEEFKLTGSVNETNGKIFIKDGTKYRFESEDQVIVTDGKTVWTYNDISKQLIIDNFRENSGALLPRDMLYKYPKEYLASLLGEEELDNKTFFVVKLDPKDNIHGFIKSMKLWIEDDEWIVRKIETVDLNGNSSTFEIFNMETKKLNDNLFSYSPDSGIEVIDLRK